MQREPDETSGNPAAPLHQQRIVSVQYQGPALTQCLCDEQLRFIADRDGFIGVTMFPAFLKRGTSATVDDYVEAIDYVIGLNARSVVTACQLAIRQQKRQGGGVIINTTSIAARQSGPP